MTDILLGLINILKDDTALGALVYDRVFGKRLPQAQNQYMPRKALMIRNAGGIEENRTVPLCNRRFDIWIFAESDYEVEVLDRALYDCLKGVSRVLIAETLIHSIAISGPIPYEDETRWPMQIRPVTLLADERDFED